MTPSVDPHASRRIRSGRWTNKRSLICALHAAPAEQIARSEPASYAPPPGRPASRARTMGSANASPTMATTCASVDSTVASSSCGSNDRRSSVVTVPPAVRVGSDAKMKPVLCMSGDAGMARIGSPRSACWTANSTGSSGSERPRKRSRNHTEFPSLCPMFMRTPLGSPVVPPVYERNTSSSPRVIRGASSERASSSSYEHAPGTGDGDAPPTSTSKRTPVARSAMDAT